MRPTPPGSAGEAARQTKAFGEFNAATTCAQVTPRANHHLFFRSDIDNAKASYAAVLGFIHEHGISATYFALKLDAHAAVQPAVMSLEVFVGSGYPFKPPHVRFTDNCYNFQLDDHLHFPSQLFVWPKLATAYNASTR